MYHSRSSGYCALVCFAIIHIIVHCDRADIDQFVEDVKEFHELWNSRSIKTETKNRIHGKKFAKQLTMISTPKLILQDQFHDDVRIRTRTIGTS